MLRKDHLYNFGVRRRVDCREKAKDFPSTSTCKRAKVDLYTFTEGGNANDIYAQNDISSYNRLHKTITHPMRIKCCRTMRKNWPHRFYKPVQ